MGVDQMTRIRQLTAVLGPTNTGKTHLAIERMLGHETGMIGLPLRLLAREIYDRVALRVGVDKVALITGEEKIKPEGARYWVCTVEAMPQDVTVDFLAIDEIQLAADLERGHVFTDRLLHARGQLETLVLGASTMREAIGDIISGANFISRPRLSKLTYSGQKKITRLPARSAIVAFSAADVYQIAELIRRQRGGAAVVLGALSPRTRNAQVALYQSGDVDFMVATDAIGMGLNLDVDHVAFSSLRKFDGTKFRNLTPAELAQIAGRAGRHMNDGTFGVTGDAEPLEQDLVDRLEGHEFEPIKTLQWRARSLDFSTIDALRESLLALPDNRRLIRARSSDDLDALENVSRDPEITGLVRSAQDVEKLWDVCQIPDYRKISSQNHAELVANVFKYLMSDSGRIDEDWFQRQVEYAARTDGDIDTLSNRLAHIRTWTFVAARPDWLADPEHWQGRTREIEDNLSDALHACLTQRFVDARASALMKGMKDNQQLNAEIGEDGRIHVENHFVGSLKGFRYIPDTQADGLEGRTTRYAASQVLAREISMRARRVVAAKADAFTLARDGRLSWRGEEIAQLDAGDDPLKPQVSLIADETLQGADRERVLQRCQDWVTQAVAERLKPLVEIGAAEDIDGLGRGIAFRLRENLGVLRREEVAQELKSLDQTARAQLRRYGVRFGAFNIFFPVLLKPAAADLLLTLWCLKYGKERGLDPANPPEPPRPGLTSAIVTEGVPAEFYRAYGFHVCGPRAVRIDMLERLADLIRPLLGWRAKEAGDTPPKGATGDGGFTVVPEMMSILGCSTEELGQVLTALGFRSTKRELPRSELAAAEGGGALNGAGDAPRPVEGSTGEETAETESGEAPASPEGAADDLAADRSAVEAMPGEEGPAQVSADGEGGAAEAIAVEAVVSSEASAASAPDEPSAEVPTEAAGAETSAAQPETNPEALSHGAECAAGVVADAVEATPGVPEPVAANGGTVSEAAVEPDVVVIEVWRPKRRHEGGGRRAKGRGRSPQPQRNGEEREAGTQNGEARGRRDQNGERRRGGAEKRGDGGGRQRGKNKRHDGGRRGSNVHTSAPARQKGIDPDSPFAKLSALKESLNKGGDSQ